MELNEAIAHCEEKAKELREEADYYRKPSLTFDQEGKEKECLECAHEHEQLADWLRELKERRENDGKEYARGYEEGKEGVLSCVGCKYGDNGIFEVCENCVHGKIDQYEKEAET